MDPILLVLLVTNAILAGCAVGSLLLSFFGFKREIQNERREGELERETTTQMLDHTTALRNNVESNRVAISDLEKAVEQRMTPASVRAVDERQLALKEAKLAQKKEADEWKKVVAVAKGIGWVLDRMKENEEEEDG